VTRDRVNPAVLPSILEQEEAPEAQPCAVVVLISHAQLTFLLLGAHSLIVTQLYFPDFFLLLLEMIPKSFVILHGARNAGSRIQELFLSKYCSEGIRSSRSLQTKKQTQGLPISLTAFLVNTSVLHKGESHIS
jgi:hypothetical protein